MSFWTVSFRAVTTNPFHADTHRHSQRETPDPLLHVGFPGDPLPSKWKKNELCERWKPHWAMDVGDSSVNLELPIWCWKWAL